jgi:glucose/arabinose dehydrogenase
MRVRIAVVLAALAACAVAAPAQAGLGLRLVASGFDQPVDVVSTPSQPNRVYVVEQTGRVKIVQNGTVLAKPLLDLRGRISCCGEQGLLSIAFNPRYPSVPRIYASFTNPAGDTRVVQYTVRSDRAILSSARRLIAVDQPFDNHNGGNIAFHNGYLFLGLGDGGSAGDPGNRAQNMRSRLGKLLRINVRTRAVRIVALGLRNPWRFGFDRKTGVMWIGDVGQDAHEEIDRWRYGRTGLENFGWRRFEGTSLYSGGTRLYGHSRLVPPIHTYDHGSGRCSITGGYVYRGKSVPAAKGRYFFGDYCTGEVWSFVSGRGARREPALDMPGTLSSFGEGPTGELYFAAHSKGRVYRLAAS